MRTPTWMSEPVLSDDVPSNEIMESSDSSSPVLTPPEDSGADALAQQGYEEHRHELAQPALAPQSSAEQVSYGLDQHPESAQTLAPVVSWDLPPPRSPPTASDWNIYRPLFTQLYHVEGRTLKETMQFMEEKHGFQATPRMFKRRAADWGLRKYQPRKISSGSDDLPQVQGVIPVNQRSDSVYYQQNMTRRLLLPPGAMDDNDDSLDQTQRRPSSLLPVPTSRPKHVAASTVRRPGRHRRKIDKDLDAYLRNRQPNLSLTQFRAISYDMKIVETILEQVHNYYDSFSPEQWVRKFPSSPRTVMKEMTLCVDLGQAFPKGENAPIHPTQLFSRYTVAMELLKSRKKDEKAEGWRMIHEAFDLFKPVLAQQHTQLLRYFFQQVSDYRLDDHPEIRKRIFELSTEMSLVTLGEQHPITKICRLLPQVQEKDEICVLAWRKSLELIDAHLGEASDESLRSKLALCGDLIDQSKYLEAERTLKDMLRVSGRQPTDYYMRSALIRLGWLYRIQNRYDEAENTLYEVLRLCNQFNKSGAGAPDAINIAAQTNLAQSFCSRNDVQQGQAMLVRAWQSCAQLYGEDHRYTTSVADELEKLRVELDAVHIA